MPLGLDTRYFYSSGTRSRWSKIITYSYDHNGNLLSKNTGSPATTVQNTYNGLNQLVQTTVGGVKIYYDYVPVSTQSRPPGRLFFSGKKSCARGRYPVK